MSFWKLTESEIEQTKGVLFTANLNDRDHLFSTDEEVVQLMDEELIAKEADESEFVARIQILLKIYEDCELTGSPTINVSKDPVDALGSFTRDHIAFFDVLCNAFPRFRCKENEFIQMFSHQIVPHFFEVDPVTSA